MCFKIRNKQLCIYGWKPLDPSKRLKIDFCGFFSKILADFLSWRRSNIDFLILTRYSEGSKLFFEPRLFVKCRVPLKLRIYIFFGGGGSAYIKHLLESFPIIGGHLVENNSIPLSSIRSFHNIQQQILLGLWIFVVGVCRTKRYLLHFQYTTKRTCMFTLFTSVCSTNLTISW